MAFLYVIGTRGRENQWGAWAIADGGDPRGDEVTDIRLWPKTADTSIDPYTHFHVNWNMNMTGRGSMITKMDAANNAPADAYSYVEDGAKSFQEHLDDLNLKPEGGTV